MRVKLMTSKTEIIDSQSPSYSPQPPVQENSESLRILHVYNHSIPQWVRYFRPFARRRTRIFLPVTLRFRARKPCRRFRTRCDGWYSVPRALNRACWMGNSSAGADGRRGATDCQRKDGCTGGRVCREIDDGRRGASALSGVAHRGKALKEVRA